MKFLFLCFSLLLPLLSNAQSLRVSQNQRFLETADGKPFFYLGDTAWELFHRLSREEATLYLENRAKKGFTVIQAVVLAELDGLQVPNAYGEVPLVDLDPGKPNDAYFEHVDFIINRVAELGLYVGLLPTWGDKFHKLWGVGPEVFTEKNALTFGEFLGKRYRSAPIIWILGGDRNPADDEDRNIIQAMAKGLRQGDRGANLITYHPQGGASSIDFFDEEEWLDFNMFQSGHWSRYYKNYDLTKTGYNHENIRPVLDSEPCYEDHPINWRAENGWFDAFDSRKRGYWSMLAGACGHTYGNHNIWQMWTSERDPISAARTPWQQSLDHPGAFQAGYMRNVFESRPWQLLEPANTLVTRGPNIDGREVMAAIAEDGSFLLVYTPFGSNFSIDLEKIKGDRVRVWWFNPRIGTSILVGTFDKEEHYHANPPSDEKRGNDWVLVVENAALDFPAPGLGE